MGAVIMFEHNLSNFRGFRKIILRVIEKYGPEAA